LYVQSTTYSSATSLLLHVLHHVTNDGVLRSAKAKAIGPDNKTLIKAWNGVITETRTKDNTIKG